MELYTLNRSFLKQDVIDGFLSAIWTERYYGDSEVELVVPMTSEMIKKLSPGTFLGLDGADEIMILETVSIEDGKLKVTGMSLLPWLNNRFIRTSDKHEDKYWYLNQGPAGWTLWAIVYYMCHPSSEYLQPNTLLMGIPSPQRFAIPGLQLIDCDMSGDILNVGIPYGPVYDAMKEIATTYQIGMQLLLVSATDTSYILGFRSYKGLDRTSAQSVNSVVRFSPQMESFTGIKELQSIAALKTLVYSFAPGLKPDPPAEVPEGEEPPPPPPPLTTVPGASALTGMQYTGFDLRALMVFADDITTDKVEGDPSKVVAMLDSRAYDALTTNHFIKAVDGEIVPEAQFQYGANYNLGDIIEVQGNSGTVQTARITEYIRAQDASGEKAYPTVSMIG